MNETGPVRRVVTGHDADGRAIFTADDRVVPQVNRSHYIVVDQSLGFLVIPAKAGIQVDLSS
jgi:hypothetical protein